MPEEMITITKKEYDSLIDGMRTLQALEAGGVDNWCGYSDSINEFYPEKYDE